MQSGEYWVSCLSGFHGSNNRLAQLEKNRSYTLSEGGNPTDDGHPGMHNHLITCALNTDDEGQRRTYHGFPFPHDSTWKVMSQGTPGQFGLGQEKSHRKLDFLLKRAEYD